MQQNSGAAVERNSHQGDSMIRKPLIISFRLDEATRTKNDLGATRQEAEENSVPHCSILHRLQTLHKELSEFNERIAELESEGHRGRAVEVLKGNAIDLPDRSMNWFPKSERGASHVTVGLSETVEDPP